MTNDELGELVRKGDPIRGRKVRPLDVTAAQIREQAEPELHHITNIAKSTDDLQVFYCGLRAARYRWAQRAGDAQVCAECKRKFKERKTCSG